MSTYAPEEEILTRGQADWVDFSEAYWLIEKWARLNALDPRQETARVLRQLTTAGLVRAGNVVRGTGFVPWDLDADESVDRVFREWTALDHEPRMGDVCWLANTAAGDEVAAGLVANPQPGKRWISEVAAG